MMAVAQYLILRTGITAVLVSALLACATMPKDTPQRLYVMEWTLIGAANTVADMKPVMPAPRYTEAKAILLVSNDALSCGKAAAGLKVEKMPAICPVLPSGQSGALGYLQLINANLMRLAAYYAAKGE